MMDEMQLILDLSTAVARIDERVGNLHAALYENGFRDDMASLRRDFNEYIEEDRFSTCPYVADKEARKEANRWRWRRSEILTVIFGFVIAAFVAWSQLGG